MAKDDDHGGPGCPGYLDHLPKRLPKKGKEKKARPDAVPSKPTAVIDLVLVGIIPMACCIYLALLPPLVVQMVN